MDVAFSSSYGKMLDEAGYSLDTVIVEEFEYGATEEMEVERQEDPDRKRRLDAWRFTNVCGKCGIKDKLMFYQDASDDKFMITCTAVIKQRGESTPGVTCGWSISI